MSDGGETRAQQVRRYVTGLVFALIATGIAFAAVAWRSVSPGLTFAIVLALALVQMAVHFYFFLHISWRKSAREDLQLILFSTLIVIMMVAGTLVLLFNLHHRMM